MEENVINQGVKTSESGIKIKKSTVPGVTLVEYTENIPEGCSFPDILRRPISLTLQEGKNANFKADVQGNPKPSVVWSFKEKHLTNDNHYKIYQDTVTKEHILQVTQLTIDDAGSYKCVFSNEYGEARCVTNLNIIEVGFKKKMKRPGATRENLPDPTAFRKMLKKCAQPVKKQDNVPDEKVWELLMNADKKDYERICLQYGITDFRGMLKKLKQMKIEREEKRAAYVKYFGNLKHTETKADGSANFGFDMELKNPNLNIFLYKDEEMIPYSMSEEGKHHLKHVGKRYNFCIKDLHPEDIGMYKITVEDASVFATEIDISHIPVAFKQLLQGCKCNETEDAVFGCTISVPIPVEWLHKNMTLEDSDKYQIIVSPDGLTHRLIVKDVHLGDSGVYTIIAGARSSSARLTVGKNLDATSHHSRSEKNSLDINLKQDLYDLKKDGTKGITDRLSRNKDITKDGLKEGNNLSEADRTRFHRRGLQDSTGDGLYGNDLSDMGKYDRMGKDSSAIGRDGLGRMDEDGLDTLRGQGKHNMHQLHRMGKDGKGSLAGMNEEEMGIGGKGRQDGIERYGGDRLGGIGADGMDIWDAMGKSGKGQLVGEGKGRIDNLDEIGKDATGNLGGVEKHGKVQLGGMGLEITDSLDGMGKKGQDSLYGMGNEGKWGWDGKEKDRKDSMYGMVKEGYSGWGGMGKEGKGSLHAMEKEGKGTGGKGRCDGLGKGGMAGLDGMGKGGMGRSDGMGKGGMGGSDGMGKGGMGGLDGMEKGGMAGLDGMGKGGMAGLDGMGKGGMGGSDGIGKGGMGGSDGMGKGGMGGSDGMGKGGMGGSDGMGKGGMAGLDGMGKGGMAGLDGMGKGGMGGLDGMGKGGMGGLDGMGKGGMGRSDGMGKGGMGGSDGMGKGGMGGLGGMGKGGMGGLGGMGKGGMAGLDGMGIGGMAGLDGMGKGGMGGSDGMGKGGMRGLDGMGKGGISGSDGMGKGGMAGLGGMGKGGMGGLDGMGKVGMAGLDGMGKAGMGGLDGMGKGGMGGLDGLGKGGMGGLDRMGKGGMAGLDGMGKGGMGGLDGMGKGGMGGLDGMGKGGMGGLDGMGKGGMAELDGMGKGGMGGLDGMGKGGMGGLDGMGKGGMGGSDGMGKGGMGGLDGMGKGGMGGLDGMGKGGMGGLDGMGKGGMGGLDGMGKGGMGGLDGMGKGGMEGLDGMGKGGMGGLVGMGKGGMGGLDGMGKGGMEGLDGMGKGGMGGLDGMGKGGMGGLDGMGKGGMGGLDGMGKGGMGGLDGMGKGGMEGLDGMGKGGMGGLDGMGKGGMGGLDGMGKGGMGGLDGMGKGGMGGLDGMGKGGMEGLDGMGKGGMGGLDGMGKGGMGGLDGMGKGGMGGLDGMGKGGMGGLNGMGKGGMGGLDGMGKGGMGGLDGMGKGGMGGLNGMGKGGMGGLDGMGKGGMGGLDGMGKGGMGGLDGMGKGGMGGLDGMGKGGMGRLDGMGKGSMGGLDGMGKGGMGGLDGMGKGGMGKSDGMGKGGMGGSDGMGKGGMGGLDGMGKGGMGGLGGIGGFDGRGTAGKGRLEETGKYGKDTWDGMGKDTKGRVDARSFGEKDKWNEIEESDLRVLEGMGKDGKSRLVGVGKDGNNSLVGISKDQLDGSGTTDMKGLSSKSRLNTFGSNQDKSGLEGYSGSAFAGIGAKDQGGFEAINALSMAGALSNMSGSAGDVNDGRTSSASNKRGLLRDDQMSIQDESMDESKQGLLASDLSQSQQSSHARRRHRRLSESELKSKEGAHYFKSGLSDISAKKGEAAELCCVTMNEEAQGSWSKDGKKITSGNGKIIMKEGAIQKLTFAHIQEEDSGIYTFEADGGRTEASLFVEDPPEFDQDVLDQLGMKPILVKAGQTAAVKVPFKGKLPMKVSWYKDGDELFSDNRIKIDNAGNFTRLSIFNCNRKDSGILTAKLKNESGIANTNNISLCVIDKPLPPQGPVEVLESSEHCISFKWKPPKDDGGKPITNYIIERQLVGRNTWIKVGETDASKTTFSVTKVEPGKNYIFKVWAVNSEGGSEALLSDTITAGRRDVPGPVATPKILDANSKSITLSWTPPKKIGSSSLIGYLIEKRKEGSNAWTVVTDHPITEKKWTVTDVVEGLKYEFRVIAVNSSGLGEPSCETEAVFAREPIRPPGTVRDLRMTDSTYSTISLAWTPPTYQANERATGYIVEMKSSGSPAWTRCNPVPIALNSYTVKNLKPMGSYFLRVRAVNDGGMGDPVELENDVLAMPPPVAPKFKLDESFKSFMIIKEGNSFRVQLPFQASPPPKIIWLKDGLPLRKQATVTNTNDGTQLFIPACQRSDSGIYSITLKNPFGQDSFSFEIRATAIPKPPGLLTLKENVLNTVTVSWEPSRDEPLDDHLHYVVKKRDSSQQTWHTIGDNIFNNKFTVINVIPGRKYYFRVLAKNDLGYSEPSDTVEPWGITKQKDSFTLKFPDYKGVNNISAPEFTVKLKTHTAPSGSDVCMSCAVKGYPPPNVTWLKDNISIRNNANFWLTNVCGVCSLCIFAASPKQSGVYMAFAENTAGRAACSTRLNIRE
ncbi:uncharacterized protein [Mobula birostris]|uniref:uncharacterized protein n=1 Tax=Mobula birostris TaxID=1983395 RepID=UPI003B289758